MFDVFDPWQLYGAVVRAAETYRHQGVWSNLVRRAMGEDVSWSRSAALYAQLYRTAVASHGDKPLATTLGLGGRAS